MSCECRNQDGTLSEICFGTCKIGVIVEQEMQQQRDPLNGFAELILAQVDKRIEYQLLQSTLKARKEYFEDYKEAFVEGFKQGFKFSKEIDDGY
jgi:hypothetical protein